MSLTHTHTKRNYVMNNLEEFLFYIENHKNELEHRLELQDGADPICDYLEGAIELSEHLLAKGQTLVKH